MQMAYYLERASIKFDNLFGIFSSIIIFLFVVCMICYFALWLVIPLIEFRKKTLLNKIYEQLNETQEILYSIQESLINSTSSRADNPPIEPEFCSKEDFFDRK